MHDMPPQDLVSTLRKQPLVAAAFDLLYKKLPPTLKYHVPSHSEDVFGEVILFATTDNLKPREIELLSIGAAYHDTGFIEAGKENESIGAQMAVQALKNAGGFSDAEIKAVETMILDTQLRVTDNGPKQIPSSPLSNYLLDADVSNLGRDDFFEKVELVRQEVGVPSKSLFLGGVLKLMKAHTWYSPAAQKLRSAKKEENLQTLLKMIGN